MSDQTVSVSTLASVGKVTGLSYTVKSDTEYKLIWNAVSGATGYEIYRKAAGSDKWVKVNTTTKTTHTAGSALTAGNTYSFRVRAYKTVSGTNSYGTYSTTSYGTYSNTITFTFNGDTSDSSSSSSSSGSSSSSSSSSSTVAVKKVKLNKSSVTIKTGKTKTLKATVTPSNATNSKVTWSSSNTSVAKVSSSGVVTAKKYGTATITVKTANGKKATCKVSVTVDTSKVKSSTKQVLLAVGKTKTVSVVNRPSGVKANWKSTNTSVATVTKSGKIKAKKAGNAVVTTTWANRTDGYYNSGIFGRP